MIIFTILLAMAILLVVFTIIVATLGGTVGLILCSDIIVCVLLIVFVMKKIINRKGRKRS